MSYQETEAHQAEEARRIEEARHERARAMARAMFAESYLATIDPRAS